MLTNSFFLLPCVDIIVSHPRTVSPALPPFRLRAAAGVARSARFLHQSQPVHGPSACRVFDPVIRIVKLTLFFLLYYSPNFPHHQTVLLIFVMFELVVVFIRQERHPRYSRALRPLFLVDAYLLYGVRRYIDLL